LRLAINILYLQMTEKLAVIELLSLNLTAVLM